MPSEKEKRKEIERKEIDLKDPGHWIISDDIDFFGNINSDLFGFVYQITLPNGCWYIGSKQFNSKKKLKPLKGKINARRRMVESDWKDYASSSNYIKDYISKNGKEGMSFKIITIVRGGKFELKYCEMKHQVEKNCLFDNNSINGIINVRLSKKKNFTY
jgi:hypothetical protein